MKKNVSQETPLYSATNVPVLPTSVSDGHFKYRVLGYNDVSTVETMRVMYAHRQVEVRLFMEGLRTKYRFVVSQVWDKEKGEYRAL